jgi:IclR family mhp operon transcriptional activator
MPKAETIRALERGLQVLQVLQGSSVTSLHELHQATGISKPSLLRILNTLEGAGVVSRRLADGQYRVSAFRRVRGDRHDRVVEAAGPVLDRLCQKVLWPSDLLVPAGDHMERRETSQSSSRFFLRASDRNRVGQAVGFLLTGVGRAYLAFCPDKERETVLRRLRRSDKPDDRLARDPRQLERILAETRKRGYGMRDPIFTGGQYGSGPRDDGLAAIAVPLAGRRRVYGSINILWIKTAFTVPEFARRHLEDLQNAAREIVSTLESAQAARLR